MARPHFAAVVTQFALLLAPQMSHANSIIGTWVFDKIKTPPQLGILMPAPDTDLVITFEFEDNGMSRLHWTRKNEVAFCERKAQYQFNGERLTEIIVWVNPESDTKCLQDPEMQLGNMTSSPAAIVDSKFELGLGVGDQIVTYLWDRQQP